ncbi:MAG: hypothetical protein JSS04_18575 [Proteobacteria bacterium]|nr:hypothetical protein [Pseudomonadota bacterium]
MSDKANLAELDARISRLMTELERRDLPLDVREGVQKELAIVVEMRLELTKEEARRDGPRVGRRPDR